MMTLHHKDLYIILRMQTNVDKSSKKKDVYINTAEKITLNNFQ